MDVVFSVTTNYIERKIFYKKEKKKGKKSDLNLSLTFICSSIWSMRAWKKSKASCCSWTFIVCPHNLKTFQKLSGSWYCNLLSVR